MRSFARLFLASAVCALGLQAGLHPAAAENANYTVVLPQEDASAAASWLFYPHYGLPGSAGYSPVLERADKKTTFFGLHSRPARFNGLEPSQRLVLEGEDMSSPKPKEELTVEIWLNDHVSGEIGVAVLARGQQVRSDEGWAVAYWSEGYSNRRMKFHVAGEQQGAHVSYGNKEKDGFKEYWRHIVGTYDGSMARLYVNGKLQGEAEAIGPVRYSKGSFVEAVGYFEEEPYMELGNILRNVRVHDRALSQEEIQTRFEAFCQEIEEGVLLPGRFHFKVAPYLSFVDETSAGLIFETSSDADVRVRCGRSLDKMRTLNPEDVFRKAAELGGLDENIFQARIEGLDPDTPYFYEVAATNAAGETLEAKRLTFRTAAPKGQPFRFAVIGDTETRPHINQKLSRLMWDERPSFAVLLGDVTDGGREGNKFQWTHEYFNGVTPMASHVPVFAVPGNGEGSLHWFNRYHALPGGGMPYRFSWGDADFFMLNTNARAEVTKGGRQFVWLEEALSASDARWKFVCFHYAPYTSEENDYGDSWKETSNLGDEGMRAMVPLFEKYGVEMVMYGHLHLYERMRPMLGGQVDPEGVNYLLCGGAGGNLEDFAPNPAPFTVKTHRGHHYCTFDVQADKMVLRMYALDGSLRDQAEILPR